MLQKDYAENSEIELCILMRIVRPTVTSQTMVALSGVGLLILLYTCGQTIK